MLFKVFFFSSRRRHTRCSRDWSSDVCSSDLRHIGEWMAEFPSRRVSGGKAGPSPGVGGTRGQVETGRWDAVAAFVSKARPRPLLAGEEDSGDSGSGASIGQDTLRQPSGLVPA